MAAPPASASPPAANASPAADSSLSALTVTGTNMTGLAPGFAPGTRLYEVVTTDSPTAVVTPTPAQAGATAVVTESGATVSTSGGVTTAPLVRGRNDISVTVTSTDRTSVTAYTVVIWRNVAPTPAVTAIGAVTTPPEGGTRFNVQLADGALPSGCHRDIKVRDGQTAVIGQTFDPATGLTTMLARTPITDRAAGAGRADLTIVTGCNPPNGAFTSTVTVPGAVTVLGALTVTSADIPATVSVGSVFRIRGPGITYDTDVYGWLEDADGETYDLDSWDWTGVDQVEFYLDYEYYESFFMHDRPMTFHAGYWNGNAYVSEYSKPVSFVAPAPSGLTISPATGPVAGGSTFLLRGRYIYSGIDDLEITVGGQHAGYREVSAAYDSEDYAEYLTAPDVLEVTVPAGVAPGAVPVTVTTEYGEATASTPFRYVARPQISSVTPAAVSAAGGSVITVTGTGFGTSGNPSVVIDGVKSPLVNRISDSQVAAVVPPSSTTGPVSVTVSSGQGGGVSPAASLTVTAPGPQPTVATVTPAAAMPGDTVTITGTGFGPAGTIAVAFGDNWAIPATSTPTSITVTVPAGATPGPTPLTVGGATVTGRFQVQARPGITSVSPVAVRSDATGASAQITLTGAGFGTSGTVKVGAAAAVGYTATQSGTRISGVTVPTTTAGPVPILVLPTGSRTPLRATVRVTGPAITYVGPDPYNADYAPYGPVGAAHATYQISAAGGSRVRVQGTGFGTGGVLTLAGRAVPTSSWSDTAITFTAPAGTAGPVAVAVSPSRSPVSAIRTAGLTYIPAVTGLPTIGAIASVADNGYPSRTEFNQVTDASNIFTLTGQNLAGTSASATRVIISDGSQSFTLTPAAVTATSLRFAAPRTFTTTGAWKTVEVTSNVGSFTVQHGVFYRADGIQVTVTPTIGYCGRTAMAGHTPATAAINASGAAFGTSGTVTVDGVTLGTTSWSATEVDVDFAQLASALTNPWGTKTLTVTPADPSTPPRSVLFTCAVTPSVTTTLNGATAPVTVTAGTAVTLGATSSGFVGPFAAGAAPGGYEYVTDADYQATGFNRNVRPGVPSAAGDYWIRVALSRATYDRAPYRPFSAAPVHLTVTGRPVTITAVSNAGSPIVYKGQLTEADFHFTNSATADPITRVTYEYRDSVCSGQSGWHDGLPGDVARQDPNCGGDGTTHSTWEVRVKSFEMTAAGGDRAGYYLPTMVPTTVDITPKPLTIASLRADKVWDGTDAATLGTPVVTGAVSGDNVRLNGAATGTFADSDAGVDKPVTLSQAVVLDGSAAANYVLSNPNPTVVGTISKAPARIDLTASTSTVLLSQNTPVTITATVADTRTGNPPDVSASVAPVVLTSRTPLVCSISGTTVTAHTAGTCEIGATEAASTNYQAAEPASVQVQVFAAQQTISVLADDLTVGQGDPITPTAQVSGLFDGDTLDSVAFDYYDGSTLLPGAPTDPGTYTIKPKDGVLHAVDSTVYRNPGAFTYVAGRLLITPQPPRIAGLTPRTGMIFGGNTITVTGARLDTVQTVTIGAVTLRAGDFTVNDAGDRLTFAAPAVTVAGPVDVTLRAGTATTVDQYTYVATAPWVPRDLDASGSGTTLTVRFTAPASDGGSAITGYQISTDGGRTWSTRVLTCPCSVALTGLPTGRTYPVVVRAVNAVGPGPWTAVDNAYTNPGWSPVVRPPAGAIAVPANPDAYQGPQRYTQALHTTYAGRPAAPISSLGAHQMVRGDAVTTLRGELFDFDSADLTAAGRAAVRTVAQHLTQAHHVTCEGYTDYAGQAAHEKALSLARAQVICRTLIADGARVTTAAYGYGGARPVVVGGTPQSRAENRRVVIRVDS